MGKMGHCIFSTRLSFLAHHRWDTERENRALYWYSDTSSKGFTVPYKAITLHAISRGERGPTVYCQVDLGETAMDVEPAPTANGANKDSGGQTEDQKEEEEGDGEEEEQDTSMVEMIFAPQDPEAGAFFSIPLRDTCLIVVIVERIFESLSVCAALHPDSDLGEDEGFDGDDAFIDPSIEGFVPVGEGEEGEELTEGGRVRNDQRSENRYAPY
jgi:hypothetical protein